MRPIVKPPKFGSDTIRIALDIPWIKELELKCNHWLYSHLSVRELIETFASIPTHEDCNEVLWNTIEYSLPEFWDVGGNAYLEIEHELTHLIEYYYTEVAKTIPHIDNHVFAGWVTDTVILIDCEEDMTY